MIHRHRGRAMGTRLEIVVATGDAHLVDGAVRRLDDLERRWSRFLPDSEISILNRHPGAPVIVSRPTLDLVQAAVDGWWATEGRFDPTVHDAVVALGYDRSFEVHVPMPAQPAVASPGAGGVDIDHELSAIRMPPGTRLDMGGIGKGTAADLVTAELMAAGAQGACVSIGGDLRVRGDSPTGDGWTVTHPDGPPITTIDDGAVCTSTTRRRRWKNRSGADVHHIVDPATGRPTAGAVHTVTVVGATAQQAEILTKAALVAGADAQSFLETHGVHAILAADPVA